MSETASERPEARKVPDPGPKVAVRRLHLGNLMVGDLGYWPVHGFAVTCGDRAFLVDTGIGGPDDVLREYRVVNRAMAEALKPAGLVPGDIEAVINTHLHFDHCGQNAVFAGVPFYVQRAEAERARVEDPELWDWFGFAGAGFEYLDGDAEIAPFLKALSTPGHTAGHQSVLVSGKGANDLLVGDAAYTAGVYRDPQIDADRLAPGQFADLDDWRASLRRMHALKPWRVHYCHDTTTSFGEAGASGSRRLVDTLEGWTVRVYRTSDGDFVFEGCDTGGDRYEEYEWTFRFAADQEPAIRAALAPHAPPDADAHTADLIELLHLCAPWLPDNGWHDPGSWLRGQEIPGQQSVWSSPR